MMSSGDSSVKIFDSTCKPEGDVYKDFAACHIQGARFMDLSLIRDFSLPYPFMMPQKAHFIRMTKAWDLRKTDTVVFYEQGKGWFATRAAFMLKAFGHQNVYVLDGGIAKWTKEGRDVEKCDVSNWDADFDYELDADKLMDYKRIQEVSQDGSV